MLKAIAEDLRLNPEWVLRGVGEPFTAPSRSESTGGLTLPAPGESSAAPGSRLMSPLVAIRHVVEALSPTVVMVKVRAGDNIVREPELKVEVGDLLALETDAAVWRETPDVLHDRIVAVRIDESGRQVLARALPSEKRGEMFYQVFAWMEDADELRPHFTPDLHHAALKVEDVLAMCVCIIRL
jgi:hypothetical protein